MNSASSTNSFSTSDQVIPTVIEATVVEDPTQRNSTSSRASDRNSRQQNDPNQGERSAIVHTPSGGSFSTLLAPLTKDTFVKVVEDVENKLKTVNQTLSILDNLLEAQGFEAILNEMLSSITFKTGELLNADRATIWLIDDDKPENDELS